MAKSLKQRRRAPGKRTNKAAIKRKVEKLRKKADKRKSRKSKQVDELADRLSQAAAVAPADAASAGAGASATQAAADADMQASAASTSDAGKLSRAELRRKLRAKLANNALDRTQGLTKGQTDSSGLNKQRKTPSRMEMG
mmetsp:Transcript_99601/g.172890  ORF Transcript_99601/g.172890 Transcript_99601/m.172890 type:complete len:140 (+) Transcript_99601:90-509(+)